MMHISDLSFEQAKLTFQHQKKTKKSKKSKKQLKNARQDKTRLNFVSTVQDKTRQDGISQDKTRQDPKIRLVYTSAVLSL